MYINPNNYLTNNEITTLSLIYKGGVVNTIFDTENINIIKQHHWRVSKKRNKLYVCTGQAKNGRKIIYLQNLISNFIPDKIYEIDHINGDSLDNRCVNLRKVLRINNIQNVKVREDNKTTLIRGISVDKRWNRFTVDFHYNKKRIYFKTFKKLEEAVYLRLLLEEKFLKEFNNHDNDEYKFKLIEKLSDKEKEYIESYLNNILKRKGVD